MNKKLMELNVDCFIGECEDVLHIPHGDMPGDKVNIEESHILKAKIIFPELIKR